MSHPPAHPAPGRPGALLAVLLTGQAMASMDGSIVTVALPAIQRDLGASAVALQLVVSSYLLALGVLIVTGARLGDLLGHRRAFLAGLAGFTCASLLCGLAPDAPLLVAARVAQATGAALMIPQVFSLIRLRRSGAALRRAVGLYSMVLALGVAAGQVAGGLVVGADLLGLSWRPVFLVNVPVGVVLLLAGARLLPRAERTAARLDLAGVALLTAAMTAVLVPLVLGPEHGWPLWTWLCLPAGGALFAAFAAAETRLAARGGLPLLDLGVLRLRGAGPGLLACVLVMGCYTAFLFALTLHLQEELGFGPLAAGLAFVPYACGFAALSLTWAHLPGRAQAALPVAGPLVFAAVAVALAIMTGLPGAGGLSGAGGVSHSAGSSALAGAWPAAVTGPLLFAAGAGHAAAYSPLIAQVSAVAGAARASAVSAINSTGPMLASVLAVAGLGGVYLSYGLAGTLALVAVFLVAGAVSAAVARRGLAPAGTSTAPSPGPTSSTGSGERRVRRP
ncbi:MFS transporter [Nonomuraea pusilla]|uniref:MFS transporter n=1 Tax=Nonomuraea pusilla TaxID=46177 RepID=UPI0033296F45